MEELAESLDPTHSDDDSKVPASHNKLLGAVAELYEKKRVKAPTRKEPSLEVSEFHLSQSDKKRSQVKVTDLANVLKKRALHTEISQKLKTAQKRAKTLPKPLEKIHSDRISRAAGYEHAKRQLNRWDAIVYQQKVADHLSFPLKSESIKIHNTTDVSKIFRKPTELELKIAELLKHPDPVAEKKKEEEEEEKKEEGEDYPLTLAEVIEKRKMMAKLRAQESYRQAKAARHSKIKSKKFHQIQRRARVKEQLREFEELQKKDPEAALKKLEELERTRAEERVTLRHRSTGQWAKNLSVRAKYDKDARIALAEQLSKSRELTVKLLKDKESESEKEDEEVVEPEHAEEDPNNPWVVKRSKEMEDFVSSYRKYWETEGKDSNKTHGSAVKVPDNSFDILKDNKLVEMETHDQTDSGKSNQHQFSPITNQTSDSIVSHSVYDKSCIGRNVFTVNTTPKKCSLIKTKTNKSLTTFKISISPVKKGTKSHNASFSTERTRSKTNVKNKIEPKNDCKSGSWTILEALKGKTPDTFTEKTSKKEKNGKHSPKSTKSAQSINKFFQVTDSTHGPVTTSLSSNHNNNVQEEITSMNAETRVHKNKSLDELFEEAEDKLHSKIKSKVGKIKQALDRKRKKSHEHISESEIEEMPSLEFKRSKTLADIDEELIENTGNTVRAESSSDNLSKTLSTASAHPKPIEDIDPNKYLKVTSRKIVSMLPEIMTEGEDALDDEETTDNDRHLTISEAFAEDDVVDQFQNEKEDEVKKNSIGDVDLTLPGWGNWAGHNMKPVSRRKRKKFVIKFPRVIPRRDSNRGNVIINEDADKPIKEHQVSELPFPFTSVKDFEASIRAPLGTTWVPQIAHQKLTLPSVVTQLGAVIRPMDESQLVKKDKVLPTKTHKQKKLKQNKAKN